MKVYVVLEHLTDRDIVVHSVAYRSPTAAAMFCNAETDDDSWFEFSEVEVAGAAEHGGPSTMLNAEAREVAVRSWPEKHQVYRTAAQRLEGGYFNSQSFYLDAKHAAELADEALYRALCP